MDIVKSNIVIGVGAALAATMLAPVLLPVVASVGRPFAKALVKGGLLFYEKSREAVAVAGEAMEDLIAEVRADEVQRHAGAGAGARHDAHTEAHGPRGDAARQAKGASYAGNGSEPGGGMPEAAPHGDDVAVAL